MAVMARDAWTDERLDDLRDRVDRGFVETSSEIHDVRGEIHDVREEMRGMRGEMREIRGELATMTRAMHQLAFGMISALIVGFFGTIAALITLV